MASANWSLVQPLRTAPAAAADMTACRCWDLALLDEVESVVP
jgi:hypothetical protein